MKMNGLIRKNKVFKLSMAQTKYKYLLYKFQTSRNAKEKSRI